MIDVSFTEKIENEFIKKIITQLPYLFFQFTVPVKDCITFNYLGGPVFDFFELTIEDIENNPKLFLDNRIHGDDLVFFKNSIHKSARMINSWNIEYRVVLPSQEQKWIKANATTKKLENGDVIFFGTMFDNTAIKIQEENHKIAEAKSQFANMVTNVGVWDWNLVTNKVYYSSESLKILEIDNDNNFLVSNPDQWDDRVHPEDREVYFGNIKNHFENKIPYYETYHRILCNGKYKWILDRGKVISRDENGIPLRIIGTHTDVTTQKEKEQNLLDTLELVNNQKNKLLNFAHIVSHNLRNHTGNLSSLLKLNEEGMFENDEFLSYVKTVSDDLSNSIVNLVDLVKVQNDYETKKDQLNVFDNLNKIFNILTDDIHKNKTEIVNLVPKDFYVLYNSAYLESILLNLTTNAIKYSNPNKHSSIVYSIEKLDDYTVLIVKDNGLGIDLEKHKEEIFGLYKTFHSSKDARGIGLHITKNQIEAMGGKIEVESKVNEGTTFRVYIK